MTITDVVWTITDGLKDAIKMPNYAPYYNPEPLKECYESHLENFFEGLTEEMLSDLHASQCVTEAGFYAQKRHLYLITPSKSGRK
jgi:hypothetical protein